MPSLVKTGCVDCKNNVYHPGIGDFGLTHAGSNGKWRIASWYNDKHLFFVHPDGHVFASCKTLKEADHTVKICETLVEAMDKGT